MCGRWVAVSTPSIFIPSGLWLYNLISSIRDGLARTSRPGRLHRLKYARDWAHLRLRQLQSRMATVSPRVPFRPCCQRDHIASMPTLRFLHLLPCRSGTELVATLDGASSCVSGCRPKFLGASATDCGIADYWAKYAVGTFGASIELPRL